MKLKKCGKCKKQLPIDHFVNWSSEYSTRGKYCRECHISMVINELYEELNESISIANILFSKFKYNWDKICLPCWMDKQLLNEFDYCIYCGNKFISDQYGRLKINIDHMNPIALGGEDSIRNVICVCTNCNIKKGAMNFYDWLKKLSQNNKLNSEKIYIKKQGYKPEDYIIGSPTNGAIYQGTTVISGEELLEELIDEENLNLLRKPKNVIENRKTLEYLIEISNRIIDDKVNFLRERFSQFFPNSLKIKKF